MTEVKIERPTLEELFAALDEFMSNADDRGDSYDQDTGKEWGDYKRVRRALSKARKEGPPRLFIHVKGGMVQDIVSTSSEIEISLFDADNFDPEEKGSGWNYWKASPDRVVDKKEFKKIIRDAHK